MTGVKGMKKGIRKSVQKTLIPKKRGRPKKVLPPFEESVCVAPSKPTEHTNSFFDESKNLIKNEKLFNKKPEERFDGYRVYNLTPHEMSFTNGFTIQSSSSVRIIEDAKMLGFVQGIPIFDIKLTKGVIPKKLPKTIHIVSQMTALAHNDRDDLYTVHKMNHNIHKALGIIKNPFFKFSNINNEVAQPEQFDVKLAEENRRLKELLGGVITRLNSFELLSSSTIKKLADDLKTLIR